MPLENTAPQLRIPMPPPVTTPEPAMTGEFMLQSVQAEAQRRAEADRIALQARQLQLAAAQQQLAARQQASNEQIAASELDLRRRQIALQEKVTGAELDPAVLAARREQALLQASKARSELQTAPLETLEREAKLRASIFEAQAAPHQLQPKLAALAAAGISSPIDPKNPTVTPELMNRVDSLFSEVIRWQNQVAQADAFLKGIKQDVREIETDDGRVKKKELVTTLIGPDGSVVDPDVVRVQAQIRNLPFGAWRAAATALSHSGASTSTAAAPVSAASPAAVLPGVALPAASDGQAPAAKGDVVIIQNNQAPSQPTLMSLVLARNPELSAQLQAAAEKYRADLPAPLDSALMVDVVKSTLEENPNEARVLLSKEPSAVTDTRARAILGYRRGVEADKILDELADERWTQGWAGVFNSLQVSTQYPAFLRTDVARRIFTAQMAFLASVLRPETGAQVTIGEYNWYSNIYFPRPGDSAEDIQFKSGLRKATLQAINTISRDVPPGLTAAQPAVSAQKPQTSSFDNYTVLSSPPRFNAGWEYGTILKNGKVVPVSINRAAKQIYYMQSD